MRKTKLMLFGIICFVFASPLYAPALVERYKFLNPDLFPASEITLVPIISSGEDCLQFYKYENLLIESVGIENYSDGLSAAQVGWIKSFVDERISERSIRSQTILVYFTKDRDSMQDIFPSSLDDSTGWSGAVNFDGCHIYPEGGGYPGDWTRAIAVYWSNEQSRSIEATLAHEFSHFLINGHGHGYHSAAVLGQGIYPNLGDVGDAYFWTRLFGLSLLGNCNEVVKQLKGYKQECEEIRRALS